MSPAVGSAILSGQVSVADGLDAPASAALYLTARPNVGDDVPRAVLSGTRGKPPPIAAVRLAPPLEFPLTFELNSANLTPEGAAEPARWWAQRQLVLSARLDADGQAATRDSSDLVGRALCAPLPPEQGELAGMESRARCNVQLVGRGFGGKLLTKNFAMTTRN